MATELFQGIDFALPAKGKLKAARQIEARLRNSNARLSASERTRDLPLPVPEGK